MKNINKNLIFYGLVIALVILVIFGIFPPTLHAYDSGYHLRTKLISTPAPVIIQDVSENSNQAYNYTNTNNPVYQQPFVYQNTYSNQPMTGSNTSDVYNSDSSYYSESTVKTSSTGDTSLIDNNYKNLTANSVFGRFSFMPSGLMQWILLGIFILVIVILVRKVTGKEEAYHATPLKHA